MTMHKMPATNLTGLKSLFLAVVLPLVTLTTAALATDDKTYVGAACRAVDPASAGLREEDGALLNLSQRDQAWICPVVRDHMESNPGFARITVQEGSNQVKCEFEARDSKGKSKSVSTGTLKSQETISMVPFQRVSVYTWGDGDSSALYDVADHGYYFFRCVIPARTDATPTSPVQLSGVITYKVGED
jgi:hypothetical protein